MKSFMISPPFGKDNLKIEEMDMPLKEEGNVTVRVRKAGLNPIDYNLINGRILYNLAPIPHVPGSEIYGIVETDGKYVKTGDRVIIYPRVFDGTCEYCLSGREYLCPHGGIWGVITNGGYSDFVSVPEKQLFKLNQQMDEDIAVSLPIGGLTAYHALQRAGAVPGQSLLLYGASGNTGTFAMQIADSMGIEVYAVSRNSWVREFGASDIFTHDSVPAGFKADIVINSLGSSFWEDSVRHVANGGSIVSFGVQTGRESRLDIGDLYTREIRIIGSTGGNRKELMDLIGLSERKQFKVRIAKKFSLYDLKAAMAFFETKIGGRIILEN